MIFNGESKNVSTIWTEFHCDYCKFLQSYEADVKEFSSSVKFSPKPNRPPNAFDISMVPWLTFTSFNINVFGRGKHFIPIFTMGKFFDSDGRRTLPLAVQVHHAVCDGYHVGRFIEILQENVHLFGR